MRHRLTERTGLLVAALVVALSLATVYAQYRALIDISPGDSPRAFVAGPQVDRNEQVLRGEGGDPWQFRVGSELLAKQARNVAGAVGVGDPDVAGLLGFRVIQNIAIFALAWLLYRRLGATRRLAAIGLCLVAWAMSQAFFNSGLSFDSYGDLIAYLAAALLILDRRYAWIVPLTVLAALNRETSGLIPVMLVAAGFWIGRRTPDGRRAIAIGGVALLAFAVTTVALRSIVGPGEVIHPHGKQIGWEIFELNVGRGVTWDKLFQTVTIVPVLAAAAWRHWEPALRAFCVAIVPLWVVVHLLAAVLAETRLILVPYVVVLVPGVLAGLRARSRGEPGPAGDGPAEDRLEARGDALARA
jgi:hypothetical protein